MFADSDSSTFRQFANSIPQLVWSATPDGTPIYANTSCVEYTGIHLKDQSKDCWSHCIHPEDRIKTVAAWRLAIKNGKLFQREFRLKNSKNEYRWFLGRAVPILGDNKEINYWFATATDIQDQKNIETELKESKEAAIAASDAKSQFLANMSHEIRTPLGAILGFAELLTDQELSDREKSNCLTTIRRNGEQLTKLIDEILDLSKVESQKLSVKNAAFSPRLLIEEVSNLLSMRAKAKSLGLNIHYESPIPEAISSDALRIRQILINIIGNAIKFTDRGSVDVRVSCQPGDKIQLNIDVKDSGTGIAPDTQKDLFNDFVQGDTSVQRKYGGTGLGLSLSRRLAQALGGDVWIKFSEPGKGSTFAVSIMAEPVYAPAAQMVAKSNLESASKPVLTRYLDRKKIMIVDDSPDNRFLMTWILKKSGADVECAEDGAEAVNLSKLKEFDAILMDIQMPVMDGFTACEELRGMGYKGPLIALTAHAMKEDRDRCIEHGFDEHLSKPICPSKLQQTLQDMLPT